jgi:hypothetical protein
MRTVPVAGARNSQNVGRCEDMPTAGSNSPGSQGATWHPARTAPPERLATSRARIMLSTADAQRIAQEKQLVATVPAHVLARMRVEPGDEAQSTLKANVPVRRDSPQQVGRPAAAPRAHKIAAVAGRPQQHCDYSNEQTDMDEDNLCAGPL